MNEKIINIDNVNNNLDFFKSFGKKITIMVKADAYGHGLNEIVEVIKEEKIRFGVASIDEGKRVRALCDNEILVVQPITRVEEIACVDFCYCVEDIEMIKKCKRVGILNRCYLKLDVGMNRFGIDIEDRKKIKKIALMLKRESFKGVMLHFPCLADEATTLKQYNKFLKVKKYFKNCHICVGGSFACNFNFDCDEMRVGIGFYGYGDPKLKPIMQVLGHVAKIFVLKKGERLGYDGEYIAKEDRKIGVVKIGYGDGIDRRMSGFQVSVNGQKAKIVGKVCMDCLFVDLTNLYAEENDVVEFLSEGEELSAYLKTIPYEVLTRFTMLRGKVVVKNSDEKSLQ